MRLKLINIRTESIRNRMKRTTWQFAYLHFTIESDWAFANKESELSTWKFQFRVISSVDFAFSFFVWFSSTLCLAISNKFQSREEEKNNSHLIVQVSWERIDVNNWFFREMNCYSLHGMFYIKNSFRLGKIASDFQQFTLCEPCSTVHLINAGNISSELNCELNNCV